MRTDALKKFEFQIINSEPGSKENQLAVESAIEIQEQFQQSNLYNPEKRESMIQFLKSIPFYQHADLSTALDSELREFSNQEAANIIHQIN